MSIVLERLLSNDNQLNEWHWSQNKIIIYKNLNKNRGWGLNPRPLD